MIALDGQPCDEPAQLVYTTDAEPGIRRLGNRRFRYLDPRGRAVRDERTLHRIASLAIPPAWTDVWICADPDGHLQATGRDAKGRKQSRYHPRFRAEREDLKFGQLVEFGALLPRLRQVVAADLRQREPTLERQTALVVHLLDITAARVGNERYAQENGSFGVTTFRTKQARVVGDDVRFEFVGKSGRRHRLQVHGRRIARLVAQCQDLPGQHLFSFIDDRGGVRALSSHHVNDHVAAHTCPGFTAKTFRTWRGTVTAGSLLAAHRGAPTKRALVDAIDRTADVLGNTRAVCRSAYVHPVLVDAFLEGELGPLWRGGPRQASAWLSKDERRTLHVLRRATAADA